MITGAYAVPDRFISATFDGLVFGREDSEALFKVFRWDGWFGAPGVRADRTSRLWGHGTFSDRGWRDARLIILEGNAHFDNEQAALEGYNRLMSAGAEGTFHTLTVTDSLFGVLTATVRLATDVAVDWLMPGVLKYQFQLLSPDPRKYGPAVTGSTGIAVTGDGLQWDLFASNPTVARRNYSVNPQALTPGTGFAAYSSGTGEAGAVTWLASQADGPVGGPASYGRWTVTTPKTSGSTGWLASTFSNRAAKTGLAGAQETVSVWLRYTGPGTATLVMRATAYNAAGANSGQGDSAPYVLQSGVWTRVSATTTATADYATLGWWAYQTAANVLPAGSTMDATGVLPGTLGTYFDGSTADTVSVDYAWTGAAGASTSTETVPAAGAVWGGLDFGSPGDPGTVTLTNLGTADTGQRFTLTGSAPKGFTIRHTPTDSVLQYSAPLALGDELVLNSTDGTVWLNGYADRSIQLTRRDWVRLGKGETGIWMLEAPESTNLRMEVEVYPAWW